MLEVAVETTAPIRGKICLKMQAGLNQIRYRFLFKKEQNSSNDDTI